MEHHNPTPDFGSSPPPSMPPTPSASHSDVPAHQHSHEASSGNSPFAPHSHAGGDASPGSDPLARPSNHMGHSHQHPQSNPPDAPLGGQPFPRSGQQYNPPTGGNFPGGAYPPPGSPYTPPGVYPPSPGYGQYPPGGRVYGMPSANGSTILTLGILSLFCFGIVLGPIAWVMGNSALASIDSGQADPSERGNVSAGRICGIISTCIHGLVLAIYAIVVIIAFATGAGSAMSRP